MKLLGLGLVAVAALVLLLGAAANGFEPTTEKAKDVSAAGAELAEAAEFELEGKALQAEILEVLVDEAAGTSAVVASIENPNAKPLANVSVAVELLDAGGEQVGTNTAPGTDPGLNHLPSIAAGETAIYVNDSIVPSGPVDSALVEAGGSPAATELRPVEVTGAKIEESIYGTSAVGRARNPGTEPLENVLVQAIVRKGEKIVAAGTARITLLAPGAEQEFQIFPVGNPKGGELTIWAPSL